MNELSMFTVILLLGLAIGMATTALIHGVRYNISKIKIILESNKLFAKKIAEMKEMKARGELHEWTEVQTQNGEMIVCKKTDWCPDVKGFVPLNLIHSYLERIQMEKEYKEYRNLRIAKLAKELDFDLKKMEDVVEKVFSIKKDFHVNKAAKLVDELKQRVEDVKE